MTDIYVPIDYSELKTVIPEGEDILYSTSCQANFSVGAAYKQSWASHVLLTQNYMAYTQPVKRKPTALALVPLYKVWMFKPRMIILKKLFWFKITRDSNYETKDGFRERAKIFGYKFLPILLDAKERRLKEMESNPEEFKKIKIRKMESEIYKVKKALEKNKKKIG